jgi:predicted DNA-binding transcriptional regulator AlpA
MRVRNSRISVIEGEAEAGARLLTLDQVQQRVPFERTWFHRNIRKRRFPQPIRPGGKCLLFDEQEVDSWIAEQKAHRK